MKHLKSFTDSGYPQVLSDEQIEEIKYIFTDFADDVDIFELDRELLYERPGINGKDKAYYQITSNPNTIHFNIYFGGKIPQKIAGRIKNKYKNLILRLNSVGNYHAMFIKGNYYLDRIIVQYYL